MEIVRKEAQDLMIIPIHYSATYWQIFYQNLMIKYNRLTCRLTSTISPSRKCRYTVLPSNSYSLFFPDCVTNPLEDGNFRDMAILIFLLNGSLNVDTLSANDMAPGRTSGPLTIASLNLPTFQGVTLCKK